jgi:putative transcription factor
MQKINEKPAIVQEYESSKTIPNQQILGKLEVSHACMLARDVGRWRSTPLLSLRLTDRLVHLQRALGVKLRGKNIGEPLAPRGSKAKK